MYQFGKKAVTNEYWSSNFNGTEASSLILKLYQSSQQLLEAQVSSQWSSRISSTWSGS